MLDACPCCAQPITLNEDALGDALLSLSDHARDVFDAILFGAPKNVSAYEIFSYCYDDDEGGPSDAAMRQALNKALTELTAKLVGSPVRIVQKARPRGWTIQLQPAPKVGTA